MPIEQISLSASCRVADLWAGAAREALGWMLANKLPIRDAVVLVPFAALLPPARAAWAALGGWQPRIETPLTLAASLGPPQAATQDGCSGDVTADALTASQLMRRLAWGADWALRDPAGFAHVVDAVVEAAQMMREAALARAPADREAFWAQARASLPAAQGPAGIEAALLRLAIEWVAADLTASTDRLFEHRPSAWIVMRLGGPVPMAEALLGHVDVPGLRLLADPPADEPYAAIAGVAQVSRTICDDFEAEAQAAAAEVLDALNAGRTPVALVALDRELVRRVRALLEREQVPLLDETGWLLSTTRAAGDLVSLLRAARTGASADARLEWLKSWPPSEAAALDSLEALWRGRKRIAARQAADRLWQAAQNHLRPLQEPATLSLAGWLALLRDRLETCGSFTRLEGDAAGSQLLAALGFPGQAAWLPLAHSLQMDLAGFTAWVEATLQRLPFLPTPDAGAQVVLMPLARSFGRPFAQVVIPGADHLRLGSGDAAPSLIGQAWAEAVGLETRATRRERQRLALAQVLRAPGVALLRRRRDGDEPLAESPDVEWLLMARSRWPGLPAWPLRNWTPPLQAVPRQPVPLPLPTAGAALPTSLSASRLEALRECPYRFFSRAVLRLDETEELDLALAKRDYGSWLHAVLHRFHSHRDEAVPDASALHAAAEHVTAELGIEPADLLPFRASYETLAPAYLAWLAEREAQGWHWINGEVEHERSLSGLIELTLRGRIDRLDAGPHGATLLLDYKTGSTTSLKNKVRHPQEDTQLAFYAALLGGTPSLQAAYLSLDDAQAPTLVEHPKVHLSAQQLLDALGDEWARMSQGAALPALGEGPVCETCEARGLCRRDHWGRR